MKFSERYGYKQVREIIQIDSVDDALKNGIWSLLKIFYWDKADYVSHALGGGYDLESSTNKDLNILSTRIWFDHFKKPLDEMSNDWMVVHDILRRYYFNSPWYEIYDFIEFVANNYPDDYDETNDKFMSASNTLLEREMSAYRFVNNSITRITEEEEIRAIEEAIDNEEKNVSKHLQRALELLSDRNNPDYRNSIKESISSVERLAAYLTSNNKGSLGQLLKILEEHVDLHPAIKTAFSNMYGYTSDESGIRHALSDKEVVDFDDAKYMLVTCSAFINYIEGKIRNKK